MPDEIIGQIDEKFFICGVDALYTVGKRDDGKSVWHSALDRLKERNISHILNVADESIYSPGPGDNAVNASEPLVEQLRSAVSQLRILGTEDVDTQDLSQYFEEMAAFVKEGREATGVVVHCRQGHSRGATGALCYLVLGTHLCLNAAFEKVHRIRSQIKPNAGFWRQLRELEASLLKKGVELKENPQGLVSDQERAAARRVIRDLDQRDLGQRYMALSKTTLAGKIGQGADRNDSREKLAEIAHRVGRLLAQRGESVAVTESSNFNAVVSDALLNVPGSSSFFKGKKDASQPANAEEKEMVRQALEVTEQLNATWGLSAATAAATGGQAMLAIAANLPGAKKPEQRTRKLKTELQDEEQNLLVFGCSTLDLFEQALQDAPAAGASKL